jgi:carbamoyltransferase
MRSETGRGGQLLTVGLGGATRHGCVALSEQGRIVGVCEQERITRVRNAGFNPSGFPDEALDALLAWRQLTRDSLGRYAAAEPVPTAGRPPIAQIEHHLGHAATAYLSSAFPAATIVICDRDDPGVSVWTGANGTVTRVDWPWTGPGLAELYGQCAELFGIESLGDERRFESLARLAPDSHEDTLGAHLDSDGHSLIVAPGWRASVAARLSASGGNVVKDDAPVAAALQRRIGDLVVLLVTAVRRHAGGNCLCLGGSLFYHSSINTLVARSGLFEHVFVPIDPGNGGLAVGTALHVDGSTPRAVSPFLGPSYSSSAIKATLDNCKLSYNWESEEGAIAAAVGALKNGLMVGWFDGGMEWGPRALGARCILANPFAPYVLDNLNQFLKHRESWRGYGLSGLEQAVGAHFEGPRRSSFMEYDYRPLEPGRFAHVLPSSAAVVRLQTVGAEAPPRFARLLEVFGAATGLPFLVNTSFNGFREPIVCSPRDAVRVFYGTGIDVLVADQFVIKK